MDGMDGMDGMGWDISQTTTTTRAPLAVLTNYFKGVNDHTQCFLLSTLETSRRGAPGGKKS